MRRGKGLIYKGLNVSEVDALALRRAYGVDRTPENLAQLHEDPDTDACLRRAELDGLKIMLFLSAYLNPGDDPVKLVTAAIMECDWLLVGLGGK